MNSKVIGTGSYLPKKIMTNHDLAQIIDTSDEWIKERSGIRQRHIIADNEATSDLASNAAISALKMANLEPSEIDLIIVATFTGDKPLPSTATMVQKKINAVNAVAFDVSAACTGFIYGLTIADQFIKTGFYKNILVIGAETLTRFTNWEDRSTCILFGDGAGAVVLEASNESGILSTHIHADGQYENLLHVPSGPSKLPKTDDIAERTMEMKGNEVFKVAVNTLSRIATETLEANHLTKDQIDWLVPHQANLRIISATGKKLGLRDDQVVVTVNKHANTSSASVPMALDEAVRDGRIQRGQLLLLEAFGGGFTWGSALIRY